MRVLSTVWFRLSFLVFCLPLLAGEAPRELTRIDQIRGLSRVEAAREIPVHVRATVTFNNPEEQTLFVQDDSGPIFVLPDRSYDFPPGTLVDVVGSTQPGYVTQIQSTSVRAVGKAAMPAPVPLSYAEAAQRGSDSRWATMQGIVRAASLQGSKRSRLFLLQMEVDGSLVDVTVTHFADFEPGRLLDAEVRATGVLGGTFDQHDHILGLVLNVADQRDVHIVHAGQQDAARYFPLEELIDSDTAVSPRKRIFTRGTLTLFDPGDLLVIEEGDSRLLVRTRQMSALRIGEIVEVTGFLTALDGSPALELGQFTSFGIMAPIPPTPITFLQALSGRHSNDLVTIEGTVVSHTRERHGDTLILKTREGVFPVHFRKEPAEPDPIPDYPPGTHLRVTGVCLTRVRGYWNSIESFQIRLRSARDIEIVHPASWWTVSHLLPLVSALLAVTLLALGWGTYTRRRLSLTERAMRKSIESESEQIAKLAQLEQQRSHILELINSFEPLQGVLNAIHAYTAEMWPEASGYTHVLQKRKLILMSQAQLHAEDVVRLRVVDPDHGQEACAHAVRTRSMIPFLLPKQIWSRPLLSRRGEILGTMTFEARDGCKITLNEEAFHFGCNLAALAIDNRRLYEEALHRSQHDQLTGLANRALTDEKLDEALARARGCGGLMAVLFLDLDGFKLINDTHGHRIGDAFLCEVTERFEACLRGCDTLGRVGGDEFVVVLAELSDPEQAMAIARRLVSVMDTICRAEGVEIRSGVSVGIALYPHHGTSAFEIKHAADAAMYIAKRAGGGRISMAGGEASLTPAGAALVPAQASRES